MSTTVDPNGKQDVDRGIYSFTLVLSGVTEITDDLERGLLASGCDDALLWSSAGVVGLDFDREAESWGAAIASAIKAVESTGLPVRVEKVVPPGATQINLCNVYLAMRKENPEISDGLEQLLSKLR